MNRLLPILIIVLLTGMLPLSAQPKMREIVYFYEEGCPKCEALSPILDEIAREYSVHITRHDVSTVEGYNLFKEHGFTTTPALLINGKKLEDPIEKSDILKALQGSRPLNPFIIVLLLGLLSGFTPTVMSVHGEVISEVARTTRQEIDVVIRSFIFYAGIFAVLFCLFTTFSVFSVYISFLLPLLGFVAALNLLNSAFHSFNSYTRVDLFIKAKFITLGPGSMLNLGLLHGVGKFSDSAPMFVPMLFFVIREGSFFQDLLILVVFYAGVLLSYSVVFALAVVQFNLFRKFKDEVVGRLYFCMCGLLVMTSSAFLFLEVLELNFLVGTVSMLVVIISGAMIGFKRRLVY